MASWNPLKAIPEAFNQYFVTFFNSVNNTLLVAVERHGLFKYAFDTNAWNKYNTKNELSNKFIFYHSASVFSGDQNKIFLCDQEGYLAILHTKNDHDNDSTWKISKAMTYSQQNGSGSQGIIIKNESI